MLKNLQNKKIAIDIDDVISSTVPNLLAFFKNHHDIHIDYDDFHDYRLHQTSHFIEKNINQNRTHEMWNEFFDSKYAEDMEIIPWSKENILKLKKEWYDITLITARWESLRPHTEKWLNKNIPEINFKNIFFTWKCDWEWMKKSEVCLKYSIWYMIEDNAENCIDLAKNWIKSYLITRPWNKNVDITDTNIKRVSSWQEII